MKCALCGDATTPREDGTPNQWCDPCSYMLRSAARKRDRERGTGSIKGLAPNMNPRKNKETGLVDVGAPFAQAGWIQYERHQVPAIMCSESEPEYLYNTEDEKMFTEHTLILRTPYMVRRILDSKGFTDVSWDEVEDLSGEIVVQFLERIAAEASGDAEPITSIHGYHWALVRGMVRGFMQQFVEKRKATMALDVLDYAAALQLPITAGQWGAADSIAVHDANEERTRPKWTWAGVGDVGIDLKDVKLTRAEQATLMGAIRGDNKGLHGRRSTRRKLRSVVAKLEEAGVTGEVMARIKGQL